MAVMNLIKLTDELVVIAYDECTEPRSTNGYPYALLIAWTGKSYSTVQRAIKKAYVLGFIDKKTSYRDGWITDRGQELLGKTMDQYQGRT